MDNRFLRAAITITIGFIIYAIITNHDILKFLYPQIQVGIVGIFKAVIGSFIGYVLGLFYFPHKIIWNKDVSFGAFARMLLILLFAYIGAYYA